ncbi:MAG: helix-turn-helix domain-containing protein [Flavobacterium nitrogenifigens]|uniref:helix-turn-helix domain-containing protein n=1 Tax=Flavobacterium nitrogenifigens TaxID=1617283 RepID=UPI00280928A6|nr:helix-turn-helix domain-containing protein [Flavobacterium nitrogenifigens]MDQ8013196.1 helix-turn-helix domain-containing protein [Flavobacterium nitrogenifigens]
MKNLLILFLLLIITPISSQNKAHFHIPDSLKATSFEALEKHFDNSILDTKKHAIYAKTYYQKSKLQHDEIIKANGMYMLAYISKEDSLFKFTDSIIALTKYKNDLIFPAKAYILRSIIFFSRGQYNKALAEIINAEKHSDKSGNKEQQIFVNQQIGLIKIELDKSKEALPLIIENYNYYKKLRSDSPYYTYSAWILSNIYNRLEKPDLALHYANLFFKKMKKDDFYYPYFILNNGISYHLKKDYNRSNIALDEAALLLNDDKINLAIAYYYKGENILREEKDDLKAKKYFEKVDAILLTTEEFTSILRKNYLNLIEISKRMQDSAKELYFLNRLIEIDEKVNKNNIVLSENMHQTYNVPHLLSQKQKIISKISRESKIYLSIGLVFFALLIFALFYLYSTRKKNKLAEESFLTLINDSRSEPEELKDIEIVEKDKIKSTDIPMPLIKELLKKLALFEKEDGYLELNLKLSDLSIKFETNNSYLSKVINQYKNKNFSQYINDLRIAYVIKKLKADKKFCKYTIKAIAQEVGFNSTESFTKAFYNNTGIQVSFFIKKIVEGDKN